MSNPRFADRILPTIASIKPYAAGKTNAQICEQQGLEKAVKLSSNENPFGVGKKALAALADPASLNMHQYPDASANALRARLAEQLAVPADNIICGNGSNDLLMLCAMLALQPGRSCVFSQHSFVLYQRITLVCGGKEIAVPAQNFGHDLQAIAQAAASSDAAIIFVANPNNPTGTWHEPSELRTFITQVPSNVLIVLDEAYCEYAYDDPAETASWPLEFDNLVITRTFSKIHGLAGLRIGYAIAGDSLCVPLNGIRQPFNANALAQAAALAALDDKQHLAHSHEANATGMQVLTQGLARLGYPTMPSQGNFISFSCENAQQTYSHLLASGFIVRQLPEYGLSSWLRTTVGTPEHIEAMLSCLPAQHV